ncbi:ABC transporter permease/M1 family aminopeptidase [Aquimarina sp. 2201CG5-10]|uniref:ABC transporter permease/M1 family aminopeptidase n=1 Tax=Aquimarina callyspongiae TaxID=3098150 RepID=UPI002AB49D61|nr:M1 family aminopeptidase [Aquimarina sp. 2201CG5-10]MDY8135908.1 M1 family aminopeptidase [Aquimarina sp. 2201CG5-10]
MWYEILKFEIKYRTKRADTYIYFAVVFLFSLVASDVLVDPNSAPTDINSAYSIGKIMTITSAFFTIITSMIMGVAALRDFDHQMESLIFINPIKKRDYLMGRFLGSFIVLLFVFSGLLFGMILGNFMPWRAVDTLAPFDLWNYLQPFFYLVLPNLFFCSAIFYIGGALSRKLMVVYTQGVFLLIAYIGSLALLRGSDNQFFAAVLDPFSFQTINVVAQFWTKIERNTLLLPVEGALLYNRIFWVLIGVIVLVIGYYKFSFTVVKTRSLKKQSKLESNDINEFTENQNNKVKLDFTRGTTFWTSFIHLKQHTLFSFKSILKETSFWAIVLCGMGIIFINSINLGTTFGVNSFPATYIIVEELQEMSTYFFLLILIFYSGELVWKERDIKLDLIHDALPISDFTRLAGKFIGLILIYIVLFIALIVSGIIFQTLQGYHLYQLDMYFTGFFIEILPFLVLFSFVSFFFQVLTNHKFLGHIVVAIFFLVAFILLKVLGIDHGLYSFGGDDLGTYSEMNGYGHFLEPYIWFKTYWLAFSIALFVITSILSIRGRETHIIKRLKLSKERITKPLIKLVVFSLLVFTVSGCYIFYNTNVLNEFSFPNTEKEYHANYEKTLKHFEDIVQPKIIDVNLKVELYPEKRDYIAEGYYMLKNEDSIAINRIHIQKLANDKIDIENLELEGDKGARVNKEYEFYGYTILELTEPLKPGDTIKMKFKQRFTTKGFVEKSDAKIIYNGTFFDNFHLPTIGYNKGYELRDQKDRSEYSLQSRDRKAKINDAIAIKEGRSDGDGEEINFEIIIGTSEDQTAIAPGYLQKKWIDNGRNYFHYKMDKPMSNFYSIVSAKYEVFRDKWIPENDSLGSPVDLEIYYHKGHEYNLDRMMNGMKKSLTYFSKNFGPYQYQQLRILEFPRYKSFAQSFPNTIPFSEGIGFLMNINDEEDVDMVFYITAHEVAHQWWGHQVNPANVQGMSMVSEALAQYSATMVLKEEYSEEKVQKLLKREKNRYLTGRTQEETQEMPLSLVESGQKYVHYGKGLINLYALQDYISEDSVNVALKRFVRDWDSFRGLKKTKTKRYAVTTDVLNYFNVVTPDSLKYVIDDMFNKVTLYENKTVEASYDKVSEDKYKVNLTVETIKYNVDPFGKEMSINVNDWIDIGIYGKGKETDEELIYLKKHKITDKRTEIEFFVNQKPIKGGIDPLYKLIDRKDEDNIKVFLERE